MQHVAATNMQFIGHIKYMKCLSLALMHAGNCLVKLKKDLSMGSCSKSFQIDWRSTFSS